MPDYNEHNLTPLDPLHHVEGLVSLSDRVARRKEEQQRRQRKQRNAKPPDPPPEPDALSSPEAAGEDDRHIDFRA